MIFRCSRPRPIGSLGGFKVQKTLLAIGSFEGVVNQDKREFSTSCEM